MIINLFPRTGEVFCQKCGERLILQSFHGSSGVDREMGEYVTYTLVYGCNGKCAEQRIFNRIEYLKKGGFNGEERRYKE